MSLSFRSGKPAAAANVAKTSSWFWISLETLPGLILAWPFHQVRYAQATFPGCAFFAAERRVATVWPQHQFVAVVGAVDHDGVAFNAEFPELVQQRTDMLVVLNHLGAHHIFFGATFVHRFLNVLLRRVRMNMDGGRVEPAEKWLYHLCSAGRAT